MIVPVQPYKKENMKKLVCLMLFFILLLTIDISFAATTWYVRTDGGSSSQCTGTVDTPYVSGVNQPCAYNHPAWVMGATGTSAKWVGGDTMIIAPGAYMIGYGMPNTVGCTLFAPYDCVLNNIPSGTANSYTRILGANWNTGCDVKSELWGTESTAAQYTSGILTAVGTNNFEMQCIEITDHSDCGYDTGDPAARCNHTYNGSSVGSYARGPGFYGKAGTNFIFKNVIIHGVQYGFFMGGINNITMQNVISEGNYASGWEGDVGHNGTESSMSGNIILDNTKWRFNGCKEKYPRSATFTPNDYNNCWDAPHGPFTSDGAGFYNTSGNWIVTNSEFGANSSDGLDLLYGQDSLTLYIDRSKFFANNGNQLKGTGKNIEITNSLLLGNCNYQALNNKSVSGVTADSCRAGGVTLAITPVLGSNWKFNNLTILTASDPDASAIIETKDRNLTCNGTETYSWKNIIAYAFPSTSVWNPFFSELTGACQTAWLASTIDHSIIYNFQSNPAGTGNSFTAPPFVSTPNPATYDLTSSVMLTSNVGGGTTASFWNGSSNDFNNYPQNVSIDKGALQFNTVNSRLKQSGQACVATSDCAAGTCNNFTCSGSCTSNGNACATGATCCSAYCNGSNVCATPITCGDGIIQAGESCDGSNLNGSNCSLQGFTGGTLSCNSDCLSFNTSSCNNTIVFPLTPILDNFTRANGTLGPNWTSVWDDAAVRIVSNAAATTIATGAFESSGWYWNLNTFGPDAEVYATMSTVGTDNIYRLYLRLSPATGNGYLITANKFTSQIGLYRSDGGIYTQLGSLISQTIFNGDSFGASIVGDTLTAYYKPSAASSWSNIGSRTDSTYSSAGAVGAYWYSFNTGATLDNFGGGSLNPITCGNGIKEGSEVCDGTDLGGQTCISNGFASGTLSCNSNCASLNTSSCTSASTCGNNTKEIGEACDGTDLNSNTCITQGFLGGGTLVCASNCQSFTTTNCIFTNSNTKGGMTFK